MPFTDLLHDDDLALRQLAKARPCPHCHRSGDLIAHGFLWGYAARGHERVLRGRRFFLF